MIEVVFAPETERDVGEAYRWYENCRTGLGEEFLSCVDACIQSICRMPERYAKVYKDYRRALVRRFPYAIFYEHQENTLTVYGILHAARDSRHWQNRLS